jgi:hypothetical protein
VSENLNGLDKERCPMNKEQTRNYLSQESAEGIINAMELLERLPYRYEYGLGGVKLNKQIIMEDILSAIIGFPGVNIDYLREFVGEEKAQFFNDWAVENGFCVDGPNIYKRRPGPPRDMIRYTGPQF